MEDGFRLKPVTKVILDLPNSVMSLMKRI